MSHIATYSHVLSAVQPELHYMGRNAGAGLVSASLVMTRKPEPDPVTVEWAEAEVCMSADPYKFVRYWGFLIEFAALTGNIGSEGLMVLKADLSGQGGPARLEGPIRLPFNIGVITPSCSVSGYELRVRVCYA